MKRYAVTVQSSPMSRHATPRNRGTNRGPCGFPLRRGGRSRSPHRRECNRLFGSCHRRPSATPLKSSASHHATRLSRPMLQSIRLLGDRRLDRPRHTAPHEYWCARHPRIRQVGLPAATLAGWSGTAQRRPQPKEARSNDWRVIVAKNEIGTRSDVGVLICTDCTPSCRVLGYRAQGGGTAEWSGCGEGGWQSGMAGWRQPHDVGTITGSDARRIDVERHHAPIRPSMLSAAHLMPDRQAEQSYVE